VTEHEAEKREEQFIAALHRTDAAHRAIMASLSKDDLSRVCRLRRREVPRDAKTVRDVRGQIPCPTCGMRLAFFVSGYNGHIHAACETQGCVSFME
jgi:hypothetical protein